MTKEQRASLRYHVTEGVRCFKAKTKDLSRQEAAALASHCAFFLSHLTSNDPPFCSGVESHPRSRPVPSSSLLVNSEEHHLLLLSYASFAENMIWLTTFTLLVAHT